MQRVKSVLPTRMCAAKICYHFTKSSPSNAYNLNFLKFCWNLFQAASSSKEAKNHKAKTVVLQHMSIDSIQQCSKYFTKKKSIGCLNRNCLIENGLYSQHGLVPFGAHFSRSYSSVVSSKTDNIQHIPSDNEKEALEKTTDSTVNGWNDIFNNAHQAVTGAVSYVENRAKEVSDEVTSQLQRLYDSYPYLENVIVPVGSTICATLLAWFVMPRILRKFHIYASRNPLALLSGHSIEEQIPYEKSVWSALEDPARYLITFLAFYELGIMIAPTTSQYLPQAWRGAVVLSVVWFLHRWKANVFARFMEKPSVFGLDRDKVLTLEKISTMGLFILGAIALAEACGVAVQSILTVGGIGGVATAFAARDLLGNVLSGLSLQFSKPFSLGDNIKAGSIEGQVVEMGLTTTSLINPEKFPIIVPNSLFASQVIVNKSRAELCACVMKIPMHIDDLEKVPNVTEEIKSVLSSNRRVSLEKELPYCFLSRIENSFLELTLGCNLKNMKKEEQHATQQDILVAAATIIKKHGAKLGGKFDDFYS